MREEGGSERWLLLFTFHLSLLQVTSLLAGHAKRPILAHAAAVQVAGGQQNAFRAARREAAHDAAEQLVANVEVVVHRPRLGGIVALRQDKGVAERLVGDVPPASCGRFPATPAPAPGVRPAATRKWWKS